jgi:hypothetical protein
LCEVGTLKSGRPTDTQLAELSTTLEKSDIITRPTSLSENLGFDNSPSYRLSTFQIISSICVCIHNFFRRSLCLINDPPSLYETFVAGHIVAGCTAASLTRWLPFLPSLCPETSLSTQTRWAYLAIRSTCLQMRMFLTLPQQTLPSYH